MSCRGKVCTTTSDWSLEYREENQLEVVLAVTPGDRTKSTTAQLSSNTVKATRHHQPANIHLFWSLCHHPAVVRTVALQQQNPGFEPHAGPFCVEVTCSSVGVPRESRLMLLVGLG